MAQTAAAHVSDPAGGTREGDWKDADATADRAEQESIGELERPSLLAREARRIPGRCGSAKGGGGYLGIDTESQKCEGVTETFREKLSLPSGLCSAERRVSTAGVRLRRRRVPAVAHGRDRG